MIEFHFSINLAHVIVIQCLYLCNIRDKTFRFFSFHYYITSNSCPFSLQPQFDKRFMMEQYNCAEMSVLLLFLTAISLVLFPFLVYSQNEIFHNNPQLLYRTMFFSSTIYTPPIPPPLPFDNILVTFDHKTPNGCRHLTRGSLGAEN